MNAHSTLPHPSGRPSGAAVLAAVLHAAALGLPVFPTGAGKEPWIRAAHPPGHPCTGHCGADGHGYRDATTDPARIRDWHARWPGIPGYGIATGAAGRVVIDLDTGKGVAPHRVLPDQADDEATPAGIRDGAGVLAWLAARAGVEAAEVLDTFTVATPSGGRHLHYAAPPALTVRNSVGYSAGRVTGLGWCIDVRAAGGYVLAGQLGPHPDRAARPAPAGPVPGGVDSAGPCPARRPARAVGRDRLGP